MSFYYQKTPITSSYVPKNSDLSVSLVVSVRVMSSLRVNLYVNVNSGELPSVHAKNQRVRCIPQFKEQWPNPVIWCSDRQQDRQ